MTSPAQASEALATSPAPAWTRWWLVAAGVYNLAWGALVAVRPQAIFEWTGTPRINLPEVWQCVGMMVGVYGVGYLIASEDSRRNAGLVLVGLLGKLLGPLGFIVSAVRGQLPWQFGWVVVLNDLVWWVPFCLILRDASRAGVFGRQKFVWESRFAATPEAVFAFHESPAALTQLIPPWEPMRVEQSAGSLAVGSRVVLAGNTGPLPIRWVALHTEYAPPQLFADQQVSGPFIYWYHRHWMLPDGTGGTILRDEVDYCLPAEPFGRWFAGWFIRGKLERMFAYRHQVTRAAVESTGK